MLQLLSGKVRAPNTGAAIDALVADGALAEHDGACLRDAWLLASSLHQALRISVSGPFDPAGASQSLRAHLARTAGVGSFEDLEHALEARKRAAHDAFTRVAASA
jgi:[glutamine synthetase] adenylyltransferase / [glutamine synthetase]-adenylyl-L-tyrosine phosphorylase